MSAPHDFDTAIDAALNASADHDRALAAVRALTHELAQSVSKRTSGGVKIELVNADEAARYVSQMLTAFKVGPQVGADEEDRQLRQVLVATGKSGAARALWEIQFADTGYPVTLRGPENNATVDCYSEEDLRDAFVQASAHGLVGRKIAGLNRTTAPPLPTPPTSGTDKSE
ncbi:MAG: hypothetical protein IAG13_29135 [Deltaproteobacteria bacterium]|nr:hypothetical protein [Nannocystaceae bacterium]